MSTTSKLLYAFKEPTFIENVTLRPNGHILLTTFRDGSVFGFDPKSAQPEPYLVAKLPGATHLTGIVQISPDVYLITGGIEPVPMRFIKGSIKAFVLDITAGVGSATIKEIACFADAECQNGMANIPASPHICLSVDSIEGRVFRINAMTGDLDEVLQDDNLKPATNAPIVMGVNGAKIRDGYLYVTNSTQQHFSRYKINNAGDIVGPVEIIHAKAKDDPTFMAYDDFDFDAAGNAYVTVHPSMVYKIDPDGHETLFAGGEGNGLFLEPTSLVVDKANAKMYVVGGGKRGEWLGVVVEVCL